MCVSNYVARILLASVVVWIYSASPAHAQRRLNLWSLARISSVQKELKMSDAQKWAVEELLKQESNERRKLRNVPRAEISKKRMQLTPKDEKQLSGILNKDQLKRVHQIELQVLDRSLLYRGLLRPKVIEKLELTQEQQAQLQRIGREQRSLSTQERKSEQQRKKTLEVLTRDQRQQWKKMLGPEFPNLYASKPSTDTAN